MSPRDPRRAIRLPFGTLMGLLVLIGVLLSNINLPAMFHNMTTPSQTPAISQQAAPQGDTPADAILADAPQDDASSDDAAPADTDQDHPIFTVQTDPQKVAYATELAASKAAVMAANDAKIAKVIDFALKQRGKPYRYGATGPNAFDCSGFTKASYAQAGVTLPRVSKDQTATKTPITSLAALQPGDLIDPGYKHVSMYIGNGLQVYAPKTGDVVKVTKVGKFAHARRVVQGSGKVPASVQDVTPNIKKTKVAKATKKKAAKTVKRAVVKTAQETALPATAPAANPYTVVRDDTLSKIAAAHSTVRKISAKEIYTNNVRVIGSNPNLIKPGQQLVMSTASAPVATVAPVKKTVVKAVQPKPVAKPKVTNGMSTDTNSIGLNGGTVDDSQWDKLAMCEASGKWNTDTGNTFYGGLQFTMDTWKAYGGKGNPANASRAQQINVAEKVVDAQGWKAWPACTAKLGMRGVRH